MFPNKRKKNMEGVVLVFIFQAPVIKRYEGCKIFTYAKQ
jgi:hypothetical protein